MKIVSKANSTLALLGLAGLVLFHPPGVLAATPEKSIVVFVSLLPQAAFAEALGGKRIEVKIMVPSGQSAETYEPTPRQMQELTQARLYFRIGMPFEDIWMDKIQRNNPDLTVVDLRQGINLLDMAPGPEPETPAVRRSPRARHHHAGKDPHIWMDPNLVKIQAASMERALAAADPANRMEYEENLERLNGELNQLDQDIRRILSRAKSRRFMIFHPELGYFARAYGLKQISIEVEGREPGPRSLADLIQLTRDQKVKTIFMQKQYSPKSAQRIAQAIHGKVEMIDPLSRDYFENLRRLAARIAGDNP